MHFNVFCHVALPVTSGVDMVSGKVAIDVGCKFLIYAGISNQKSIFEDLYVAYFNRCNHSHTLLPGDRPD